MAQHGYYNIGAAVSFKRSLLGEKKGARHSGPSDYFMACINFIFRKQKAKSWFVVGMDLGPNFGIPADPVANEYRLRHVGRISYPVFQVSLSVPAKERCWVGLAAKIIHFVTGFRARLSLSLLFLP